ncbi:MAG: response regulator [SAR324 cluster bacterium]|nr:response regulator [SAR324 cluster bacterium]
MENKHILFVDDEQALHSFMRSVLEPKGFRLTTVLNGRDALVRIQEKEESGSQYDLMITDLAMPILGGLGLISAIKDQNIELPIIVLTGFGEREIVVDLLNMGINTFLDKPILPKDLCLCVEGVLQDIEDEKKRRAEELRRLQEEKQQEALLLEAEQDTAEFFNSIFYFFVLANLEETPLLEILESALSFLQDEMQLDVVLMLDSGEICGELREGEMDLFLEADKDDELYFKKDDYSVCSVSPLSVLVRNAAELEQDKLDVFTSAAASRLTFALAQDNKKIMNTILGEAVFMINSKGQVEPGATDVCLHMFNVDNHEQLLKNSPGELLYGKSKEADLFQEWIELCFNSPLDFGELQALQPKEITTLDNEILNLDFFPIYYPDKDQDLRFILLKFRDITQLRKQEEELEHLDQSNMAVIRVIQHRNAFRNYYQLIADNLSRRSHILSMQTEDLTRTLHTAKGMSGLFNLNTIQEKCHAAETLLKEGKEVAHEGEVMDLILSIQEFLDSFLEEHDEVLGAVLGEDDRIYSVDRNWYLQVQKNALQKESFDKVGVENIFKQITFVPLRSLFEHFGMLLQDLAVNRGKLLHPLDIHDDNQIFVPDQILNSLANSLIHIFRNAVDHGIAEPEVRASQQKDEYGTIKLLLQTSLHHLVMIIEDDGQGMDLDKLKASAVSKGVIGVEQAKTMKEEEAKQLVFMDGFSTKEQADMVSGRGVGMGDVKNSCVQLGGSIDYQTTQGRGTSWCIKIPLISIYGESMLPGPFALKAN